MSNLAQKVRNIVTRHQGAYISGSGKRTIEDQIKYVKQRPGQYPRTLRAAFAAFGIEQSKMDDAEFLKTVYSGKDAWLRRQILETARRNQGFQHLSGNAVDVSVRNLDSQGKEKLKKELEKAGFNVILEYINGANSKYFVSIDRANVFHVDLLNSNQAQESGNAGGEKDGPIYKAK